MYAHIYLTQKKNGKNKIIILKKNQKKKIEKKRYKKKYCELYIDEKSQVQKNYKKKQQHINQFIKIRNKINKLKAQLHHLNNQ